MDLLFAMSHLKNEEKREISSLIQGKYVVTMNDVQNMDRDDSTQNICNLEEGIEHEKNVPLMVQPPYTEEGYQNIGYSVSNVDEPRTDKTSELIVANVKEELKAFINSEIES